MIRSIYRWIRKNFLHEFIPLSKVVLDEDNMVVEVIGFFHSATGLGQSARLCAQQLQKCGVRVRCKSIESVYGKNYEQDWSFVDDAGADAVNIRIIHVNPPMLPLFVFSLGIRNFLSSYNIAYWAWELRELPREWRRALNYINAVFVPSTFTADAIRAIGGKQVKVVPHPVTLPVSNNDVLKKLNIQEGVAVFSSVFSFGSAVERKNPEGVISAFKLAFPFESDVALVLKASKNPTYSDLGRLNKVINGDKRIKLITESWASEDVAGLIRDSRAYISLHRSEGYGLTIAEAMALGTPVIVTGWSGNMDFCFENNSMIVPYTLQDVRSESTDFDGLLHSKWAEPDIAVAASMMKSMRINFVKASEISKNAQSNILSINKKYSYLSAIRKIRSN